MNEDAANEFEVFRKIYDALHPLGEDARSRVTRSIITMLAIDANVRSDQEEEDEGTDEGETIRKPDVVSSFSTFAELFNAASPTTNGDKALVAGYWLQICLENPSFSAQAAQKELTHLGHKLGNITSAINTLKNVRPQLVLQLKKSGSSKQARKTYKVSHEGKIQVEEMVRG